MQCNLFTKKLLYELNHEYLSLVGQQKHTPIDALYFALDILRATYYRHQQQETSSNDADIISPRKPKNALDHEEKQQVLDILHSERFVDKTPYEVFNSLIDDGEYYCSTRTMYRVLLTMGRAVCLNSPDTFRKRP